MSQEFQYFFEDEVYRFNKKDNLELGMVLENAEFVSSSEDSDNEEDDKVIKGCIRVAWYPKGEEQVLPERKVGLADRSLMPGDVVRRLIKGKDTQRGYCRQVHVSAGVQIVGTKFVILNVDSNGLTPLEEFTDGIAVALDSWVGMVNMVKCKIIMVTSDGSKCVMTDHEALDLDDVRDSRDRDSEFRRYDFYPGQKLIGPAQAFEEAEWVHKTKEIASSLNKHQKLIKVTVEEVQVVQLGVRWQCRAFSSDNLIDKEQPKYIVQGDDLKRVKMLNVFEPCTLQLGDRNYYKFKEGDAVLSRNQWRKSTALNLMTDSKNLCPLRPRPSKKNKKHFINHSIQDEKSNVSESDIAESPSCGAGPTNHLNATFEDSDSKRDSDADADSEDWWDTVSISSGASTGSQGRKYKKGPALMTKVLKKKKLKRAKRKAEKPENPPLMEGDRLVVETLMTTSKADVVWQDGSVEKCIPSTVLYPIHHLDDQEFFPGDFVVEQRDALDTHEYGVVQGVDHGGRIAIVKWFHTYTAGSEPQPIFKAEEEVSVYDLRDHPDFRYRPGSVVIRVANFENDQTSSTGQVLDNFPSGEVSVWWVDGKKSVCYPQDLYKVGEYDSDEGELWDETASDESWETESEHSVIAEESENENDNQLKTKLVANIEKARIAMSRLEEIFTQNPSLQTTAVMKQLLDCYKECRCMDKLMGTSFFHEGNFQGLIEKVRERGRASTSQRMAEQFNRLFSTSDIESPSPKIINGQTPQEAETNETNTRKNDLNCNKNCQDSKSQAPNNLISSMNKKEILTSSNNLCENLANLSLSPTGGNKSKPDAKSKNCDSLRHKRMSETDMLNNDKQNKSEINLKDSKSCGDLKSGSAAAIGGIGHAVITAFGSPEDLRTSHMCAQLCSLMKTQLLKTYEEVVCRYGGHFDMSLMQACQDSESNSTEPKDTIPKSKTYDVCSSRSASCPTVEGDDAPCENGFPSNVELEISTSEVAPECVFSPTDAAVGSSVAEVQLDGFQVLEAAPDCHKFKLTMFQPTNPPHFYRTVRKEMKLLSTSLPPGIWVRGYEDRMDLYSVMIRGPERTPYEDGLFFFDFQLSADYPKAPPLCHYVTYCSDKLNPNLYEDGKVCISLLGTWSGKGTEVWTSQSSLLQVIISIQGLILVNEPYFNEAGYERQKGTQQGRENSRMYNEMVVLKLIQALSKIILNPPEIFKEEIVKQFETRAYNLVSRLVRWLDISEEYNEDHPLSPTTPNTFRDVAITNSKVELPEYPLIPASKGFCITLHKTLQQFRKVLESVDILPVKSSEGPTSFQSVGLPKLST